MTEKELVEIEQRWNAGPWLAIVDRGGGKLEITDIRANDVPILVAEVRRLSEKLKQAATRRVVDGLKKRRKKKAKTAIRRRVKR
jgi:hypothetical protein